MSATKIEWTERTWNPTTGCDKVSEGCDNCYALTLAKRLKGMGSAKYQNDGDPKTSGPGFGLAVHPDTLAEVTKRKKPTTYFVNSMSDMFHKDVPLDFILEAWTAMGAAPQHTFQVLTKRPQRMAKIVDSIAWDTCQSLVGGEWKTVPGDAYATPGPYEDVKTGEWYEVYEEDLDGGGEVPLDNVWLGTSIELDKYSFRANHLRKTPAAVRFLSLEPLLGPLPSLDLTDIGWVIVGGESGPGARPMHPDWVRDIRDRCEEACIPFHFKQWGAWTSIAPDDRFEPDLYLNTDGRTADEAEALADGGTWTGMFRVGKKKAGRELDGRTWDEMPEVTR